MGPKFSSIVHQNLFNQTMHDSLINCLKSTKIRYVSIFKTIVNWYKNSDKEYSVYDIAEVRSKYKKSDTIFILGGAESINEITDEQWRVIERHDSIGMNWWPVHKFVPSFYYTNYPRDNQAFLNFKEVLDGRLKRFKETVFFISGNRAVQRGIHPRVIPALFSERPRCCFYTYRDPIIMNNDKKFFTAEIFGRSLYYRGGLTLILDLMNMLEYQKIVLLGIDLRNRVHFYDHYPEMQWQFTSGYSQPVEIKRNQPQSTLDTKNNTKVPVDEYLYAVDKLYFKPNGIKLYVGSPKSVLSPRIPVYDFTRK